MLMSFAKHYKTGETLPDDLYDKLVAAKNYRSGTMMLRQLHFSVTDLDLHATFTPGQGESIYDREKKIAEKTTVMPPLDFDRFLVASATYSLVATLLATSATNGRRFSPPTPSPPLKRSGWTTTRRWLRSGNVLRTRSSASAAGARPRRFSATSAAATPAPSRCCVTVASWPPRSEAPPKAGFFLLLRC